MTAAGLTSLVIALALSAKGTPAPKAPAITAPAAVAPAPAPNKLDAVPQLRKKTRYLEGMGRTPQENALLEEMSQAILRYEEESKDFRREVQLLVQKKYDEKRRALGQSYERVIRDLEVLERKERLDAVAQFEEFLQRYPDDPKYSPDVMFRLGELYYERSSDDHILAMREFEERVRLVDPNSDAQLPAEPQVNFSKAIALYEKLITNFPGYRLNDGAYYLLGYCHEKQNETEKSLASYQTLIAQFPKSRFTTEAWVRIGEYYFDAYNIADALPRAAEAYEKAVQEKGHPLYDKALYKLGWTYYRLDNFDDAVARFMALADHYEAQAKARGDEKVGGDLRNEALQYTAISFADENWGSLDKARARFARSGPRPYEGEIYRRLGNVFFDQTRHAESIEAYRLVLEKEPLAPDAPQIQQRIVQAYERDRKLAESFREAQRLAELFGPGTVWYQKNQKDPDVISSAQELAEKSLYSSAIYHHQQALALKQQNNAAGAQAGFEVAAKAYATYMEKFPRSKNVYEMEFYLSECLYNTGSFQASAKHYEAVRDSTAGDKYRKESALAAVLARQRQLDLEFRSGKVVEHKPLKSTERPEGQPVKVFKLADAEIKFIAASDAYATQFPGEERAPGIAYKTAELYFAHNDFPEARTRFEELVRKFPTHEVAKYATNLIVESFLVDEDWRSVEEVSARLAENKEVANPDSELYRDLVKFKLAGRFKLADQLMAKGEYEEAAQKYIQLVDEEPKHEFADKALNNAAVANENTRRFDSALRLYERLFREYPASPLAGPALFRVAVNAENSYDFDKAVKSYLALVKDYPSSKDREAAMYNAGRLLEALQRYDEAAQTFLRYADTFPDAEDAPKNQFRAALIYEKQDDPRRATITLWEFIKRYAQKPAQAELLVDAYKRIGDAQRKMGSEKDAAKMYEAAAKEFDRRGLKPEAHPVAAQAAAQSRFELAENEFRAFDRLTIGGKGKALEKSFTAKRAAVKRVNDSFAEVFKYKRLEWTLAALYRRGFALERFAATIIETPIPPDVKRLGEEAVIAYQDLLAQQTVALEDKAVESYAATLVEARKNRLSNEWTKKTLESLNRYRPKEYPVLKDPKAVIAQGGQFPVGLITQLDAQDAKSLAGGDDK